MTHWLEVAGAGLVISFGIGKFLPGMVIGKIKAWLDKAKVSPWWRDTAKPWRWNMLISLFQFLEGELPNEGSPEEGPFYEKWGNRIVGWLSFIPILKGTAGTWAKALNNAGNKLDTELKADVKEMSAPQIPPAK